MAKYKKIPVQEQEELKQLKKTFDDVILIATQRLQLKQIHVMEKSETIKIEDTFTFTGKSINFVIYDLDDPEQVQIVEETNKITTELYEKAHAIKSKYGYENVRSMRNPRNENLSLGDDRLIITLSVNQTRKIRPFDEEKIDEWSEKNYLGFGKFWEMINQHGMSEFCGFSYIARDIRVKIKKEQFSLNNGVFIGVRADQEVILNIRVNPIDSVKRQDYLGDSRTFFTITNDNKKELNIYAKSEDERTKFILESLSQMYDMAFAI